MVRTTVVSAPLGEYDLNQVAKLSRPWSWNRHCGGVAVEEDLLGENIADLGGAEHVGETFAEFLCSGIVENGRLGCAHVRGSLSGSSLRRYEVVTHRASVEALNCASRESEELLSRRVARFSGSPDAPPPSSFVRSS
jgi:hypothetical protein